MFKRVLLLVFLGLFVLSCGAWAASLQSLLKEVQSKGSVRVIVKLKVPFTPEGRLSPASREAQRQAIMAAQEAVLAAFSTDEVSHVKTFRFIPYLSFKLKGEEALKRLFSLPQVEGVYEDQSHPLPKPLKGPYPPTLSESTSIIRADAAWARGYTGQGWAVAILDTGVDSSHPFLAGKVVAEGCFSTNDPVQAISSVCPNGQEQQTGPGSARPCPYEGCEHGTHVAGIAAGHGAQMNGVAPGAQVIAVQVFSAINDPNSCPGGQVPCVSAFDSDILKGLEFVYSLRTSFHIAAINMSLGGGKFNYVCDDENPAVADAINTLTSTGIAVVVASGNNGYCDGISFPACVSTAVSVGATDKYDNEANFSNYDPNLLDLFAPGVDIYSSVPGGSFEYMSGTSMAAPHVTGAWALIKQAAPQATVSQVLNALKNTGAQITSPCDWGVKPRIDVMAAIQALGGGEGGGCDVEIARFTVYYDQGDFQFNPVCVQICRNHSFVAGEAYGSWDVWEGNAYLLFATGCHPIFVCSLNNLHGFGMCTDGSTNAPVHWYATSGCQGGAYSTELPMIFP